MRVMLVDPKGNRPGLNTGLAYLAGSLIQAGHRAEIIDFNNCSSDEEERLSTVRDADLIGVSLKTFTMNEGVRVAEKARTVNPAAALMCGGVHIGVDGVNFMREHPVFDLAAVGEAEATIVEIAEGRNLDEVGGIIHRKNGELRVNEPRTLSDLNRLAFPRYDCFDSITHYQVPFPFQQYPLLTSRGCPYSCSYCAAALLHGGRWRSRSPEDVVRELEHIREQYGLGSFSVIDDNCAVDSRRIKELCRLLIEHGLEMDWECSSGVRANLLDDELIGLMKRSGVFQLNLGIEHTDPEIRRAMGREDSLASITRAVGALKKVGIRAGGFFMIGLPGSTRDLDREMVDAALHLELDMVFWSMTVPYPGTKLHDVVSQGERYTFLQDWRHGVHVGAPGTTVFESSDYPAEERIDAFCFANLRTRCYSGLVDMNSSFPHKAATLLKMVFKYDRLRFPRHLFWLVVQFFSSVVTPRRRL